MTYERTRAASAAPAVVQAATRATAVAFIASGFAVASWASRIPQVRDGLHLTPSELGLVLLSLAGGSVVALPLSGPIVARVGSRKAVTAMAGLLTVALAVIALGYPFGVAPVVVGLFLLGFANGAWDVAMNVQGALVEHRLGRSVMSRFHAGWSVGSVGGAVVGSLLVLLSVPVSVHLAAVAVAVGLVVPAAVRRFLPDAEEPAAEGEARETVSAWAAWTEPRTLLIGVFVLAFAFAEGTANDWIGVAVIDSYEASDALGAIAFACFLTAMTTGRWFGPRLLDRFGRVPVARGLTVVALVGLALFVLGPSLPVAFGGIVLWGLGTSLGFPMGMSAGADDPDRAAARVGVISSIGYCAFLAGPPLVGFLGDQVSVLRALVTVAVLLGVAAVLAESVRPLPSR